MNSKERIVKTLSMEEPDIVPITELDVDIPITEAITGETFQTADSLQTPIITDRNIEKMRVDLKIKCYQKIGFDLLTINLSTPDGWEPRINIDGTMVDLWGRVLKLDKTSKAWIPYSTFFSNPEDFWDFIHPDPLSPGWMFALERAKEQLHEEMALCLTLRDPFAHAWEIFTPIKFVQWMYRQPNFIKRVIKEIADFNIEIIKKASEIDVDLILSAGDYCDAKGPMVPISFFKDTIFPHLKRQVDATHKAGIKFIKHTDGNVNPLLHDLANIVDGLHSLDPSAGVDIGKVKEEYGDKLVLIGNISVDNLASKEKADIVQEVKNCIKKASPGGGHILSSSNSWAAGARLENCLAMVDAKKQYGTYPIKI